MDVSRVHSTNASLRYLIIVVSICTILLLSAPVKAETGSVVVSNESDISFQAKALNGGAFANHQKDNFTVFYYDTGNFTTVTNLTVTDVDGILIYTHGSEVSSFHCVDNCTGGGTASYSASLHQLNWVWSSSTRITGQTVRIAYDNEIFLNVSVIAGSADINNFISFGRNDINYKGQLNATQPMFPSNTSLSQCPCLLSAFMQGGVLHPVRISGIVGSGSVTNFYTVTYPNAGWFVMNISKSGQTINTKDSVHSQTNNSASYETETTFNTEDVTFMAQQTDGIYLNVTMATGDFTDTLINASGSTVPTPSPTATPITTLPTAGTENYIIPSSARYSLGDTATLFWGIDSSIFNVLRQIDIDILRPDGTYDPNTFSNLATDSIVTGQVSYQVLQSGTYTAYLNTCLVTCFLTSPANKVHLSSTTLNVSSPQPFIIAPPQVLANQQFNITYSYDTNLTSEVSFGYISMRKNGQGSFEQFQAATIDTSTHTISNATLHTEGTYTLCLSNTGKNTGTCTLVVVVVGSLPPTTNITTSNITLSKVAYMWGESLQGNYGIDNTNYSRTDGATLFWDIYNTDLGVETMSGYIGTQTEHFSLLIENSNHYIWDGKNVVLNSFFQNGNNQFRIFAQNSTSTIQIVNASFTLGETNSAGYGIKPDPSTVPQNIPFRIIVTSPTVGKVVLIPLADVTQEQEFIIAGSTSITTALSVAGVASMYLYNETGYQQASNQVNITVNLAPPSPTSPFEPSSPEQGAVGILDGWVAMFNLGINQVSRFLFALIITVIFMLAGALVTRNLGWGTLFGIIPFVFFAFIGYIPLLLSALVVIAIGLKLRFL